MEGLLMANPTLPALADEAAAKAIAGVLDVGTGISHVQYNAGPEDVPSVFTQYTQATHHLMRLLGKLNQGAVVKLTGLNVGAFALNYQIGATAYAYAGDTTYACTDDATNYLYLDTDETLKKSTSAWPGTSHVKLAKVVCAAGAITSIADCRWMNLQVGSVENWYDYAAGAAIDINDESLDDVGGFKVSTPTHAEVSGGGAITYAALAMAVEGNEGAVDNLDTITYAGADEGRLLLLTLYAGSGAVTVRDGIGNVSLASEDCILDDGLFLLLYYSHDTTTWYEVTRSKYVPSYMERDVDAKGYGFADLGRLNLTDATERTIAAGVIAFGTDSIRYGLLNQASDPTDDLDTISGGDDGDIVILQANSDAQVPTVKHAAGNIELANAHDYELSDTKRRLLLEYDGTLSKWCEVARSHWTIFDLEGTGKGLRWQPTFYLPDTLADDTTLKMRIFVKEETTIIDFSANVATAPSGGVCVVHILDDSVSIGSASIADGENDAESGTLNHTVAASSILEIRTGLHNTADELTVTINGRKAVPAS